MFASQLAPGDAQKLLALRPLRGARGPEKGGSLFLRPQMAALWPKSLHPSPAGEEK